MSNPEPVPLGWAIVVFIFLSSVIGILILIISFTNRNYTDLENQCISRGFAEVQIVDNVKTLVLKQGYEQEKKGDK